MKLVHKLGAIAITGAMGAIASAIYLSTAIAGKTNALKPCTDTLTAAHKGMAIAQIATARDSKKDTDYVVFAVGAINAPAYWEPLVAVNSGVCRIVNGDRMDSDKPISNFTTPEIAEKLSSLVWIRKIATAGGKKQFEASLTNAVKESDKPLLMPSEIYNSLNKLGIKIPDKIKPFDGVPTPQQLGEDRH